jgi:hypothetical protein
LQIVPIEDTWWGQWFISSSLDRECDREAMKSRDDRMEFWECLHTLAKDRHIRLIPDEIVEDIGIVLCNMGN